MEATCNETALTLQWFPNLVNSKSTASPQYCKIEGQAAYDILTHVEQHWRKATRWHTTEAIQFKRIQWILSPSANIPPEGDLKLYMTNDNEPWSNWHSQVLLQGPPLCVFMLYSWNLWTLSITEFWNSGSIVQRVLRFWSVSLLSLCFWAKCGNGVMLCCIHTSHSIVDIIPTMAVFQFDPNVKQVFLSM
jgi:hypothetical protein